MMMNWQQRRQQHRGAYQVSTRLLLCQTGVAWSWSVAFIKDSVTGVSCGLESGLGAQLGRLPSDACRICLRDGIHCAFDNWFSASTSAGCQPLPLPTHATCISAAATAAGYCADRLLRAYAGGQYCSKFER